MYPVNAMVPPPLPKIEVWEPPKTTKELHAAFSECWNGRDFVNIPRDFAAVCQVLRLNVEQFKHLTHSPDSFGVMQKINVPPNSSLFVRADLHGDLNSLLENLQALHDLKYLDHEFKCAENVHLVFLGDYVDRGKYGVPVLYLLATLRMENPDQVHLVRGNHEYVETNLLYREYDLDLWQQFLMPDEEREVLSNFYETMPLCIYVSEEAGEYVQFTHGTFEPQFDPSPLLDSEQTLIEIPLKSRLSDRIKNLAEGGDRYARHLVVVARLDDLALKGDITAFNWGDLWEIKHETQLRSLGDRSYKFSSATVDAYLRVSSVFFKVICLIRGHQHRHIVHPHDRRLVAITLPIGVDALPLNQADIAYIFHIKPSVADWKKIILSRDRGDAVTYFEETLFHEL